MKPKAKKTKPDPDFLDLFIHRMNMKESKGIDSPRIRVKGEMVTADTQFDMPIRGVYPERGEWETEREQWIELGKELSEQDIKDWDYEQKIDQYLDLDLFRALEEVYVPQKTVPPLRQLAELMRHKGSPDTQKRVVLKMEKAWQEGLEDLELRSTRRLPLKLTNWEDEEIFPRGHKITDAARILRVDRGTIHNWINAEPKKIHPSKTGRIPISEIKRIRSGNAPVIE